MLLKGAHLLKSNGIILYMVCSFLKIETDDQINKFLKRIITLNYIISNLSMKNLNILN